MSTLYVHVIKSSALSLRGGSSKYIWPIVHQNHFIQIVSTNLIGSILCTKEAIQIMKTQCKGGHVFNMDGAGSGGSSTPLTAV